MDKLSDFESTVRKYWTATTLEKPDDLRDNIVEFLKKARFVFKAEGRANVVFEVVDQGTRVPGVLLRVPKSTLNATPHDYERLQHYREQVVEPAVGAQYLVPQMLLELSDDQTKELNSIHDPTGDHDTKIISQHAMLIQDMTPGPDQLGLEFKPKWLAQSPLAPEDASRCRTCAREAHRNNQKVSKDGKDVKDLKTPICPLGLIHESPKVVDHTIKLLTESWSDVNRKRLKQAFEETGILTRLRDIQTRGDPVPGDTMFKNPNDPAFGLAMTLRDCTCFVRMSQDDDDGPVETRLADVDEKNSESKATYWQHSHQKYVEGGFYHEKEEPQIPTMCMLNFPADLDPTVE